MGTMAPILTSATYDGTSVKAQWTPSADPDVLGYKIRVSAVAGDLVIDSPTIPGRQAAFGTLTLTGPLNSASGYTVQIVAQWSTGDGQVSTSLALVTALPQLDHAWYDGQIVHFEWTPSPAASRGYVLKIYSLDSGATYQTTIANPYATRGDIPASSLPAGGLGANEQWVVAVCAQGASGVSGCTVGVQMPKPLPAFATSSATYFAGETVGASWTALGAAIATYRVLVEATASDQRWYVDVAGGTSTNGTVALPARLAVTQGYTLRVLALNAAGVGAATRATPILTGVPTIVDAEYGADAVALSWSAPPGANGYTLTVAAADGSHATSTTVGGGVSTGSVATGALDPTLRYFATVAATATSSVTAVSTPLGLLSVKPAISGALYDTRSVTVDWTPVPAGAARGYVVTLSSGGSVVQSVAIENLLASTTTIALASPLPAATPATVRVTAVAPNGARVRSDDLDLLRVPPSYNYVTYDGSKVLVGWQTLPGVARYDFTVVGATSGVRYSATFNSGSATSGSLPLPGQLGVQDTYLYTLTATAASGAAVRTVSAILPTALPALEAAVFDGDAMQLRWRVPAGQASTSNGFRASVVSQTSGATQSVTVDDPAARTATVPAPAGGFDPAQDYTASVSALAPAAASAQSANVALITTLPGIRNATYYGDRATASWTLAGGRTPIANYRLSLASEQDAQAWSINVGSSATFATVGIPQPLNVAQNYAVSVAAVAAGGIAQAVVATGPVVVSRPQLESAVLRSDGLALTWALSSSLGVTGYTLKLLSLASGASFTTTVASTATSGTIPLTTTLDPTQLWVAEVWANAPVAGVSDRTIVLAQAPTLTEVRYDGDTVVAEWTGAAPGAIPGQTGYALVVGSGSTVISSAIVGGNTASVAIPAGLTAPQATVVPVGPGSTGLAATQVDLIPVPPTALVAETDAVTGVLKLNWTGATHATKYNIANTDGAAIGDSTTTSFTFPAPPAANVPLSVVVTPSTTAGAVAVTGPATLPFALPTGRGAIASVDYSVDALTVSWSAVPGASKYRISIIAASASTPLQQVDTPDDATSYTFAPTITDYTKDYRVVVQALSGGNSGPPSDASALFTAGWYPSRSTADTYSPFVYPAANLGAAMSTTLGTSGGDLTLYLPDIGGGTALQGLPVTRAPFTLAAADTPTDGYPYKLVLAGSGTGNVWEFTTAPIRGALATAYVEFVKAIETAGSVPSGTVLVQQALARYMPQTFQETLYYSYGLAFPNPTAGITYGYADLRPGMVLRVVFNDYMAVGGSSVPQWLNGYVGGSQIDYDVGSYLSNTGWTLGFDAFIAQLVANGALKVTPPPTHPSLGLEGGSAEASDLFYPDFREPFYRVFVPTTLMTPSGTGTSQTAPNFVLAAAPTFTALSSTSNVPGPGATVAYFRGRAVIKLCIRVSINGNDTVVPIGTTVANVLERYSRQPPIVARELRGVRIERALAPAALAGTQPAQAPLDVAATYPVQLGWQTLPLYAPGWSALALPLLHGDRLTIEP